MGKTLVYAEADDVIKAFDSMNSIEALPIFDSKPARKEAIGKSYWDYKINFIMPNGSV